MLSKPGTPCNDYNGYCDVFQRCREVIQPIPLFSAFLISCHLCWMKQGTVFHLYLIPLSILITQRLTRQILIRRGGSQRTVGNSEKATLVGRQPSKLPTMDDRSLVHRCSNYPPLTFDLGKFSFPMFPVQFFFLFRTTRRVLFFLIINIEKVRKQYSGRGWYFKSIGFGYQDKNVEQSYKTDVLIFIIRSVCESFFGNNETKTKFVNLIAISIFKLRNVGNRSSVGPLILIGETVIINLNEWSSIIKIWTNRKKGEFLKIIHRFSRSIFICQLSINL